MTTAFEDGAGSDVAGQFLQVTDRDAFLTFTDSLALDPTVIQQSTFTGSGAGGGTYPLILGSYDSSRASVPGWLRTAGTNVSPVLTGNGDKILIPIAGVFAFTFGAQFRESGTGAPTAFQVGMAAIPIPGRTTPPFIVLWTGALSAGDVYTPVGYAEALIPGGFRWEVRMNVAGSASESIDINDRTRQLTIRRVA